MQRVAGSDVYLIEEIVWSEDGQVTKGVIFIIVQLVNGALTAVLIGWFLLPLVGIWAMIDAYMTAKHNNERYGFR